jgi:hypothetical protein
MWMICLLCMQSGCLTLSVHRLISLASTVNIDRDANTSDPAQSWAEHLNNSTTIEPVKMRIHAVRPHGRPVGTPVALWVSE